MTYDQLVTKIRDYCEVDSTVLVQPLLMDLLKMLNLEF